MRLEWTEVATGSGREVWDMHLRHIGSELVAEAAHVAADAITTMRAGSPELFADSSDARDIELATTENISQFGQLVTERGDPHHLRLPEATARVAGATVQRDLGLAPLLRVYSLGHERVWAWLFHTLASRVTNRADLTAAAGILSRWLFAYVNESTRKVTAIYEEERRLWLTSALAEQAEAAAAIVSGDERDEGRASRRLRYDVGRVHLGVCAWVAPDAAGPDPQPALRRAVRTLAALAQVENPLILPDGPHALRAWLSSRRPPSAPTLAALHTHVAAGEVRLSVGNPGVGVAGFRRTHLEARHARRVSRAVTACRATIMYDDIAVTALGTADNEQAGHFVRRVLGPLADDEQNMVRIAETLAVFLDENASRSRAAVRLHIHPNTVSYRVRQAERLLDRTFDRDTLALRVALALAAAVGRTE